MEIGTELIGFRLERCEPLVVMMPAWLYGPLQPVDSGLDTLTFTRVYTHIGRRMAHIVIPRKRVAVPPEAMIEPQLIGAHHKFGEEEAAAARAAGQGRESADAAPELPQRKRPAASRGKAARRAPAKRKARV